MTAPSVDSLFSPAARANPQAIYARMREIDPVYRTSFPMSGNTLWVLTGHEDCTNILKDARIGKEFRTKLPPEIVARYQEEDETTALVNRGMLFVDPPDHTRLRGLVHKAFTPRIIENLRPRIQQIADDLIDTLEAKRGETVDLINEYAYPLPITVIAELLGVPTADRDQFRTWTKAMIFGTSYQESAAAAMSFIMYFHEMFDDRRTNPKDDLTSGLLAAEENGETLTQEELTSMLFLLLVAGHETTVNLIGNGTLALLQHPDQLQMLRDDPSLMKNALEEMLRYNGPVETSTHRWAFEDIEIGGKRIQQGDVLLASLVGANRDPEVFDNPDTFDITRDAHKHLGFGAGIHYCLGAPLARLEGTIAMNTLVQRMPTLELAVPAERLKWNPSILIHGMTELPVRV